MNNIFYNKSHLKKFKEKYFKTTRNFTEMESTQFNSEAFMEHVTNMIEADKLLPILDQATMDQLENEIMATAINVRAESASGDDEDDEEEAKNQRPFQTYQLMDAVNKLNTFPAKAFLPSKNGNGEVGLCLYLRDQRAPAVVKLPAKMGEQVDWFNWSYKDISIPRWCFHHGAPVFCQHKTCAHAQNKFIAHDQFSLLIDSCEIIMERIERRNAQKRQKTAEQRQLNVSIPDVFIDFQRTIGWEISRESTPVTQKERGLIVAREAMIPKGTSYWNLIWNPVLSSVSIPIINRCSSLFKVSLNNGILRIDSPKAQKFTGQIATTPAGLINFTVSKDVMFRLECAIDIHYLEKVVPQSSLCLYEKLIDDVSHLFNGMKVTSFNTTYVSLFHTEEQAESAREIIYNIVASKWFPPVNMTTKVTTSTQFATINPTSFTLPYETSDEDVTISFLTNLHKSAYNTMLFVNPQLLSIVDSWGVNLTSGTFRSRVLGKGKFEGLFGSQRLNQVGGAEFFNDFQVGGAGTSMFYLTLTCPKQMEAHLLRVLTPFMVGSQTVNTIGRTQIMAETSDEEEELEESPKKRTRRTK